MSVSNNFHVSHRPVNVNEKKKKRDKGHEAQDGVLMSCKNHSQQNRHRSPLKDVYGK